ncbi:ATP-binding protein [Algicella marina]|uniref:AAA family ATPase n=1 Tax=Algicella marina TaxID=2683284 RepID=A0A6P1T3U5_9RHOB|nr:ATP-binding protein [Algicella marina]QHQ36677.1 AAA family ATPase [Algicella marina]
MTLTQPPGPEMTLALLREGLEDALEQTRSRLRALAAGQTPPPFAVPDSSVLPRLAAIFHLNEPELELLTLSAAAELDPATGEAIHAVNGTGLCDTALAQRLLGPAIWDALVPEAPLRRWRLLELTGNGPLYQQTLCTDERILHTLLGNTYADARLTAVVRTLWQEADLTSRERTLAGQITEAWSTPLDRLPVILLSGTDAAAKRNTAAAAAQTMGLSLFRIRAEDLPTARAERHALAVLLDRELALSGSALLFEGTDEGFADTITGPTIVSAEDPALPERAPILRLDLPEASRAERRTLWHTALGHRADILGPALDRISSQFALAPSAIRAATATLDRATLPEALAPELWQAARLQGRRALDGLADRIDSNARWVDLVLPQDQLALLHDLTGHMRDAWVVNESWGWRGKSPRGLGAAALFAGPSGTGKTLAAEVLAGELQLDLYRIDLSQIVSKYIGETEKNLARIFTAAEHSGAILLFDEADALFGKRSEVKDSHDRYANVEVSYLLQRMEAYSGLAILTTNQKGAVDTAFLRRLRYVLTFPFPDTAARAEIWRRIFPENTPTEGLSPPSLARLSVAGGSIRSIALNAAYLAAQAPEPVTMGHIRRAARREYTKLEKPFTNAEMEAFR